MNVKAFESCRITGRHYTPQELNTTPRVVKARVMQGSVESLQFNMLSIVSNAKLNFMFARPKDTACS